MVFIKANLIDSRFNKCEMLKDFVKFQTFEVTERDDICYPETNKVLKIFNTYARTAYHN